MQKKGSDTMNRLEQQMQFALEVDKEKMIYRQTYRSDNETFENDAEHAWHAALMTILLSEYASEPFDVLKAVTMLTMRPALQPRPNGNEKPLTGFLTFCRKIRHKRCWIYGWNLRQKKLRKPVSQK